ncbi:5-hydroxytryptamine receptor 2A-like isoform X2 [Acropora millepora]|uniref:5-hydroxytryptamine receptor 2A-like isoform X2 n=1 Tax=Acropora millepora TaxID=45264 RepID=UPI001CF42C9E|nr:5-hydroxytryptamine receptor 2A-like isoform X2 [Acropora millepora]
MVSVTGNALVRIIIVRHRRMRTVTNYFILNLAVADLAVTCICIPFDIPVQENDYRWPYGGFLCRTLYPLQTMFGPTPGRRDNELRGKMARRSQIQKDLHHVTFPRAIRDSFECHGFGLFKNGKTVAKMCPKVKDPGSCVAYSIETLPGEGREKSRSNAHSRYSSFCNLHPSQQCYMAMVGLR